MFLTPGASRLDLPNPCSSSTISSVHDPESPTRRWNSITVTSCGSPSRWRCWTHGHLQKGPPAMGTPWPSFSLVSSALVAPRDLKNLSFSTLCPWARGGEGDGAKLWPKPWMLLMGQAFPTKSSWACVHWWSPWSRVGFKPLNGIYPGLRSGPVAEEGPDVGLFPFLFLFLLEIMTELMS